jgi:hypothetical protein
MNTSPETSFRMCRVIIWSVLTCLLPWETTPAATTKTYVFEEYPAETVSIQKISKVDWASYPEARLFRTRFREAIGQRPDFAGYYKVVTWGCGTMCQTTALIDARDGKVYFAPFTSLLGLEHRANSRLLVENPPAEVKAYVKDSGEPKPKWLETIYWQWDEDQKSFHRVTLKG